MRLVRGENMKYTTTDLISVLSKFPPGTEIDTEISLMWDYPLELKHLDDTMTREEFIELTRSKATRLCLFEGSWDDGTIPKEKILMIKERWELEK